MNYLDDERKKILCFEMWFLQDALKKKNLSLGLVSD